MTAYYNEIDPNAAEWLRQLIKMGAIAPGDVGQLPHPQGDGAWNSQVPAKN